MESKSSRIQVSEVMKHRLNDQRRNLINEQDCGIISIYLKSYVVRR